MKKDQNFWRRHWNLAIKMDDLGDPLINDYFAIAIGAATREEIDKITEYTFKVNDVLKKFFADAGIDLIDFKIEFGRFHGDTILADEISPVLSSVG